MTRNDVLLFGRYVVEAAEVEGAAVPYSQCCDFPFKLPIMKGRLSDSPWNCLYPSNMFLPRLSEGQMNFAVQLSGSRSSIIQRSFDSPQYRAKGSGYEDGPIILKTKEGIPRGEQLREFADRELKANELINKMLGQYGHIVSAEPAGRFDYKNYPFSSSVYRLFAETRVDELMNRVSKASRRMPFNCVEAERLKEMLSGIGMQMGALLATFHENDLCWGTELRGGKTSNAHFGNFTVGFKSEESLFVGMVDFDHEFLARTLGIERPKIREPTLKTIKVQERLYIKHDILDPYEVSTYSPKIDPLPVFKDMADAFDRGYETKDTQEIPLDPYVFVRLREDGD